MEILEEFPGSNDQTIVKGKRSKRLRPSSSASSSGGGYGCEFDCNSLVYSSPATSSSGISTSTEEDENMANCLILLARGDLRTADEEEENKRSTENKFRRWKFTEIAAAAAIATTNGEVGICVYECKTCDKTFPAFQALGGHRASHKKPNRVVDDDRKKSPKPAPSALGYEAEEGKFVTSGAFTPPISTRLMNKCLSIENKPKIHECSICGSEFGSGQALGGHMRRHRSATNSNTTKSANGSSSQNEIGEKARNMLGLDLNLPAPEDDDCGRDMEFHDQFLSDQKPHIVFSSAALVSWHYQARR